MCDLTIYIDCYGLTLACGVWSGFVLFCFLFSCFNQERRNGRGFVGFFSIHVSPLGRVKGNAPLLQNENLEGTSPFTFVFYGTTVLNKAFCYFAVS